MHDKRLATCCWHRQASQPKAISLQTINNIQWRAFSHLVQSLSPVIEMMTSVSLLSSYLHPSEQYFCQEIQLKVTNLAWKLDQTLVLLNIAANHLILIRLSLAAIHIKDLCKKPRLFEEFPEVSAIFWELLNPPSQLEASGIACLWTSRLSLLKISF